MFNRFFKDKACIALVYGSNVTTDREGKEHLNVELRKIKNGHKTITIETLSSKDEI